MFKKIKDWLGANLDVYKVEKADDVGAGLVRHKWQGEQTATQTGTTLTADILNNFQKGLIPFVETVRTTGTDKDIYTVSVNGLKEFGLFDGLKLLLQIDNENQYNNSVININDSEYPLYSVKNGANEAVKKGSLRTKGYYFITYNQNAFYLNAGNVLGTEADTALEGKRLAEIIGLEYGGNIQDTGAKVTGKFYYDKALKYYYECIANNNLTYNDGSKFRAISNKPILDKVENLSENWQLVFNGLLQPVSRKSFIVPIPKKSSKIRILSSIGINDEMNNWFFQEITVSKTNYTIVNGEHYLNYSSETDKYYYFKIISTTNVDDNYAYIYVK
nr:MAG TPA: hypothetical protein [Caudoviricetes sp.]